MVRTHRDLLDLAPLKRSTDAKILIQLRIREVRAVRRRCGCPFGHVEISGTRQIAGYKQKNEQNPIKSLLQASFAMSTLAKEGNGAKLGLCRTSTEDFKSWSN